MRSVLTALTLIVSALIVPLAAGPAEARCAPPDNSNGTIYAFKDRKIVYHPTNIKSHWVRFPKGGTITYDQTRTMEINASMTATVEAEAGVIFAKASTSLGVTVGASKSRSQSWSYSANVPRGKKYRYRLRANHYAVHFSVMKKRFDGNPRVCDYRNAWKNWQRVSHAPSKADKIVWKLERRRA